MRLAALCRSAGVAAGVVALGLWPLACGGGGAAGTFIAGTPDTLTVATAQVPDPGFWQGTPTRITGGFEYGLAHALADRFGLSRIRVIVVPFKHLLEGNLGGADLALSDITVTQERSQHVSFSTPYLAAPPSILVRPGPRCPTCRPPRACAGRCSGDHPADGARRHDPTLDSAARARAPAGSAARAALRTGSAR